jgi:hypothetical protein|nr:hypothetical protein [Kofleriaceae bacterium]
MPTPDKSQKPASNPSREGKDLDDVLDDLDRDDDGDGDAVPNDRGEQEVTREIKRDQVKRPQSEADRIRRERDGGE